MYDIQLESQSLVDLFLICVTSKFLFCDAPRPWNARSLIRDRLNKQGDLARTSPLRKVPVKEPRPKHFVSRQLAARWNSSQQAFGI